MQLFILTHADGSPIADKSEAAVTSMTDTTPLDDVGELVLGDSEGIELKFTTSTGSAPSFAGGATYTPAITLGSLTTDGSGNYASAAGFSAITGGWSARIALTSTALISAINIFGSGYGNPRGGWLTLQVQVTDPDGYVQTYALLKVFVEWRVVASSSLDPLTPIEQVLANSANVAALKAALGLTGPATTLFLTSTADATDASGSTGTFGVQGGISVVKAGKFGGALSASNLSGTNTGDQTITLTGDLTGSGTGSFATTLATVNSNVGSYGGATAAPVVTVNAKGQITAASSVTITPAIGSVTGLGTGVATLLAGTASGTGGPAATTSPSFTTPSLGAATGTTLRLTDTTDSTSTDGANGSFATLGGLSVKKSIFTGGKFYQNETTTLGSSEFNRTLYSSSGTYNTGGFAQTISGAEFSVDVTGSHIIPSVNGLRSAVYARGSNTYSGILGYDGSVNIYCPGAETVIAYNTGVNIDSASSGTVETMKLFNLFVARIAGGSSVNSFFGLDFSGIDSGIAVNAYGLRMGDVYGTSSAFSIFTGLGVVRFGDTSDSSTSDGLSGALRCLGGMSLAKKMFVGTDLRVNGKSGFNNTAPIAKPTVTGSRGSNAALASLLTALSSYGLVTDSTS